MSDELKGAEFGDLRLTKRLVRVAERMAAAPEASFPKAAGGDAALEGTYRFLNHPEVTPERILEPHVTATVKRAEAEGTVIVAHDTTEFRFRGDREGMGWLDTQGGNGFFGHFALALSSDGKRRPLGVVGLKTMNRQGAPKNGPKGKQSHLRSPSDRESLRWYELAADVSARLRGHARVIHVMDREADSYRLFAQLIEAGDGFVIRMRSDRRIIADPPASYCISERMASAEELFFREVPLSTRNRTRTNKRHKPRSSRLAKLAFSAVNLMIRRPDEHESLPPSLTLNVVRVYEVETPPDVEPIEWTLVTNEPVDTFEQIGIVVDAYRARWAIEEFFKALKTGCAFESRQLESLDALLNALAVFTPIAWRLLLMRRLGREDSPTPASAVLTPLQLRLLRRKTKLPEAPTVRQAMLAVAQIGGHIKNNGDPGWIVLGRGYEELLILEEGARAVLEM